MIRADRKAKLLLLGHSCSDCHFCKEWIGSARMGVFIEPECKLRPGRQMPKMNICELWEMRGNERFTDGQ